METYFHRIVLHTQSLFKSYYVVWKPLEKEEKEDKEESLNRTM